MSGYFQRQPSLREIAEKVKGFQSWIEVNLDAIGYNLEHVRTRTGREVIPCVKSNAYGHGIVPVVAYMEKNGVKRVLVAKLWEAEQLKRFALGLPQSSTLRSILLAERDNLTADEFLAKMDTWLRLAQLEN